MREKLFIKYEYYGTLISELTDIIKESEYYKNKKPKYIYGIIRGGLPIAVHLSHKLGIPLLGQNILPLEDIMTLNPDDILIVDDICDTGRTLEKYKGFTTATLFYKPRATVIPTFSVFQADRWIVFPWEHEDEIPNREE